MRPTLTLLVAFGLVGGCRDRDGADPPAAGGDAPAWFVDVTGETGLDFVHTSGGTGEFLLPEIMGGGAALFDFDGDGDLDLYLVNGHVESDAARPTNRLYRQEADGRFVDATDAAGLGDDGYGMGAAVGDIDNDGDPDVYVTNHGPDRLYRNRGDGTFEDITAAAGIDVDGWSCSAVFLDFDRDGWLDLYVSQYVAYDPATECFDRAGRRDYCGPTAFTPATDVLLRNRGDATAPGFADVTASAGIGGVAAAGLGVVADDFNDDGWPDLYVANDAYANNLWINLGDGTFRDDALALGAAYNLHGQTEAGMGVVAADLNGDARPDLFVTHLSQESNTFYGSIPDGPGFSDATGGSGLAVSSMPYTGFGTAAFDADLDGDLDVAVANGRVVRGEPAPGATVPPPWDMFAEPNLFYVNDGAGGFTALGAAAAALCGPLEITRGMSAGDLDGDGDLDLVVTNIEGPARIYRNQAPRSGRWLVVRAVDPALGRDAIGARVRITTGPRRLARTITRGGYLGSRDPRADFGLGPVEKVEAIEVRWPDGTTEWFDATGVDRAIELVRGTGRLAP